MKFLFTAVCLLTCLQATLTQHALGQSFNVSGKVTDQTNGEPLIGATIKSNKASTATDFNGEFKLTNLKKAVELTVTYIGYSDKTITVDAEAPNLSIALEPKTYMVDEVIVSATRANIKTPTTRVTINKEDIEKQNMGQDLPFLLNWTPSLVTTSDAGAGIGYTGLRIRGSDQTRINVTINGVPLNDSESQGVFWVDIPDIASSTENIQIQRGVGTSTNGAGAFGGTINLQTNTMKDKAYAEIINAAGSYNTWRHTLGFGTGLMDGKWAIDGRVSKITSDGYIDRATSDLDSYYFSGGYYGEKTLIKAIVFGGAERTYQSWYGTPEAVLKNDSEGIEAVISNNGLDQEQAENMRNAGRTFNWYLYEDQVDDYKQDHYQLHISQQLGENLIGSAALHYTYGRGFYEQFRREGDFADYGLNNVVIGSDTIEATDLIRRRWLDNDFYGVTYSLNYEKDALSVILGGAYNEYRGGHFGEIIWAEFSSNAFNEDRYYDNDGNKDDFNSFLKVGYELNENLNVFADLQYRNIQYDISGIDNDLRVLGQSAKYDFFNPKMGANYTLNSNASLYATFGIANREPVRSDFIDSPTRPAHETLRNLELGYRMIKRNVRLNANFYYMDYSDQLVLTGALNDVGSALRENVNDSYRRGIELEGALKLGNKFQVNANLTLSQNKIASFDEVIYDYGAAFDEFNVIVNNYSDTDIAYSPNVIAGSQVLFTPTNNLELALLSKYVGKQYLDNTSNDSRAIDAYFVNDFRVIYNIKTSFIPEIGFNLLVNNIFNELYASNGYTFGYQGGAAYVVRENYYYPQAETNFLVSVTMKF